MVAKVLFVDADDETFQFRRCMAKALSDLPPLELYHASRADKAFELLESKDLNVIVIDEELQEEYELFIEGLNSQHPPVLVMVRHSREVDTLDSETKIAYMPKNTSLAGMHQTLLVALELAASSLPVLGERPACH